MPSAHAVTWTILRIAVSALLAFAATAPVGAQPCVPHWSTEFPSGGVWDSNGDGSIEDMVVFDDGRGQGPALYVAGRFRAAGGIVTGAVARWTGRAWSSVGNPDENSPTGFQSSDVVKALAVFDDGSGPRLYAAGHFSLSLFGPIVRVAAWNGTVWEPADTGLSDAGGAMTIRDLEVYDDGTGPALYAGGYWSSPQSPPVRPLMKLSGGVWRTVEVPGQVPTGVVETMTVWRAPGWPRRRLVAGGAVRVSPGPFYTLAMWDGTAWSTGGIDSDTRIGPVYSLAVHDDGSGESLYVGATVEDRRDDAPTQFLQAPARWDGTDWHAVGIPPALSTVYAMHSHSGVGGSVLAAVGEGAIAIWDGVAWRELSDSGSNTAGALATFDDGHGERLHIAGKFSMFTLYDRGLAPPLTPVGNLAVWDGTDDCDPVGNGVAGGGTSFGFANVRHLAGATPAADGSPRFYVGGSFYKVGGTPVHNVAMWDGGAWRALGPGLQNVQMLETLRRDDGADADLYAAVSEGPVTSPLTTLLRWDGESWTRVGYGVAGGISSGAQFELDGDPALAVAGRFESVGGGLSSTSNVAAWAGDRWRALGEGLNGPAEVRAVREAGGPALYAFGQFTASGSTPLAGVARWSGSAWEALPPLYAPPERSLYVADVATHDEGSGVRLHAVGTFALTEGGPLVGWARLEATGWVAVPAPAGYLMWWPTSLAALEDRGGSTLFMSGQFIRATGPRPLGTATGIVRWRGRGDLQVDAAIAGEIAGFAGFVNTMEPVPSSTHPVLLVGGYFASVGGVSSGGVAVWNGCPAGPCAADFDGNAALDVRDVFAYLGAFFAGEARADLDHSGGVGVPDVFLFLRAWFEGC